MHEWNIQPSERGQLLEALLVITEAGLWKWELVDDRLFGSTRLRQLLRLPDDEWDRLTLQSWAERVHRSDRDHFRQQWQLAQQGKEFDATYRIYCGDGQWRWLHDRSCALERDSEGNTLRMLGMVKDITARQQEKRLWHRLARSVPGIIYTFRIDAQGRPSFPFTSSRVREFYGVTPEDVQQNADLIFNAIHPEDRPRVLETIQRSSETLEDWQCEYRARAAGQWRWVEGRASPEREPGGSTVWHGLIYLIEERKALEERLRELSITDELTGLYNRRHLMAFMAEQVSRHRRYGTPFSMVMIDLDQFKLVNDEHGHATGDLVLQRLAKLLAERLRESDIAGRSGGEEFLLLLPDTHEAGALAMANQIREAFSGEAFTDTDGKAFHVSLSAGVAEIQGKDEAVKGLWTRADQALYRAKSEGRNRVLAG